MVYEWDEKRARRACWTRRGLKVVIITAALGGSAWIAAAFGFGF